jgi:hypothetical protein
MASIPWSGPGNRGSPAIGFQPALRTTGSVGGYDPEAKHGASGIKPAAEGARPAEMRYGCGQFPQGRCRDRWFSTQAIQWESLDSVYP